MDDTTINRLKEEMVQAIAAAVAADPNVEACREKARAAGIELQISLDAELRFASRSNKSTALVKAKRPGTAWTRRAREINANDRLFLKSLRIAPDEIPEVKS
jgi:hypothetical protein